MNAMMSAYLAKALMNDFSRRSAASCAGTTRNPSRSSGYVRSFWTESSSSTSRMVEASTIRS